MAESNRYYSKNASEPIRVFAQSSGTSALKAEAAVHTRLAAQPAYMPEPYRSPLPHRAPERKEASKPQRLPLKQLLKRYKVAPKVFAVFVICSLAAMALFVVFQNERISRVQHELNSLNKQIAASENLLEEANVEYLFSIDVEAARDAAQSAGMVLPTGSNAPTP